MQIAAPRVQITDRDLALLRGLFESRIMTLAHAAALYFGGSYEAAKKRLQSLKLAGVVGERPRSRAYDPSILYLTKNGFESLDRAGAVADYSPIASKFKQKRARVSPFTVRHELDVLSVKSAFASAIRKTSHLRVEEFSTWPKLFDFTARQQLDHGEFRNTRMKPDGFIRITEARPDDTALSHYFFLEVDRSTETQQNLRGRASGYLNYYRSGAFAERLGRSRADCHELPFRVLWVFRNDQRLQNAARSFMQHNLRILSMPWLTTFDKLIVNPLTPIWTRPLDLTRSENPSPQCLF